MHENILYIFNFDLCGLWYEILCFLLFGVSLASVYFFLQLTRFTYRIVNAPCRIVWILVGRKQTWCGVSCPNTRSPWISLFTHQHPAQTGLPQSQTTVSNLAQSVPPFLWLLLPPSRPQPSAKSSTRVMQSCRAGGWCGVCACSPPGCLTKCDLRGWC